MTELTLNQWKMMRKLGKRPLGYHFAANRSESMVLGPLVRSGLVHKSSLGSAPMYALTPAGEATLEAWQDVAR